MELKPQNDIDHQELGYSLAVRRLITAAREKKRKRLTIGLRDMMESITEKELRKKAVKLNTYV